MRYFLPFLFVCTTLPVLSVNIVSLEELRKKYSLIQYEQYAPAVLLSYQPFLMSLFPHLQPHQVVQAPLFCITVSDGTCLSQGALIIDDYIIQELCTQTLPLTDSVRIAQCEKYKPIRIIDARVAVIDMIRSRCYFHWVFDVLGRLALLEMMGVEYDSLFVSQSLPFMHQSLELWGVPQYQILADQGSFGVQARELIIPSLVTEVIALPGQGPHVLCSAYYREEIIKYIRNKLLQSIVPKNSFSKKVFVSRQDSTCRMMLNEDEVFEVLKAHGFERYVLSQMTLAEQIELFEQADVIVGAHGSGLTNIIFCKPGTKIIELFQARRDSCFYNLAQVLHLEYCGMTTSDVVDVCGDIATTVSLNIIDYLIANL